MENTYTAITEQGDDWWVIQLEEYPEIITQTRRLDQIPDMVRDALTLFPEITKDPENATIVIQVQGEVEELAKQARELDQQAKKLQEQASNCMRDTVQKLVEHGLKLRDIGTLLNISSHRVQKLSKPQD